MVFILPQEISMIHWSEIIRGVTVSYLPYQVSQREGFQVKNPASPHVNRFNVKNPRPEGDPPVKDVSSWKHIKEFYAIPYDIVQVTASPWKIIPCEGFVRSIEF